MGTRSKLILSALVVSTLLTLACSSSKKVTYRIPPRVDLRQHEMIGVIEFDSSAKGEIAPLATRRFMEAARADQGLIRMIEFGSEQAVLTTVGKRSLDTDAYKALGQEHGVRTIMVGELTISDVRPGLRLSAALDGGTLTAQVDATLAVRMIETATGASIWSSSSEVTTRVGHLSVFKGGDFVFDAEDPEAAYGELVDALVARVTRDFRATYERR